MSAKSKILSKLDKEELLNIAEQRGITAKRDWPKDAIIEVLAAHLSVEEIKKKFLKRKGKKK